jgi:dephospho-CoA kinase
MSDIVKTIEQEILESQIERLKDSLREKVKVRDKQRKSLENIEQEIQELVAEYAKLSM